MGRKEKGESVRVMGGTEEKGEAGEGRVGGGRKKWEEKVGKKKKHVSIIGLYQAQLTVTASKLCHRHDNGRSRDPSVGNGLIN